MEIFITLLFLSTFMFYLGYISGKNKMAGKTLYELLKTTYNCTISPLVKDIYILYTSENGLQHFKEQGESVISIPILGVAIWSYLDSISLYRSQCNEDLLYKQYGKTLSELDRDLNAADIAILKKICSNVKYQNRQFINRVFIEN